MIIAIIIISVILIISLYINYNLYRKLQNLKSQAVTVKDNLTQTYNFYVKIMNDVVGTFARMKAIDKAGTFEADDEVGRAFEGIYGVIELLKDRMKSVGEQLNKNYKEYNGLESEEEEKEEA